MNSNMRIPTWHSPMLSIFPAAYDRLFYFSFCAALIIRINDVVRYLSFWHKLPCLSDMNRDNHSYRIDQTTLEHLCAADEEIRFPRVAFFFFRGKKQFLPLNLFLWNCKKITVFRTFSEKKIHQFNSKLKFITGYFSPSLYSVFYFLHKNTS